MKKMMMKYVSILAVLAAASLAPAKVLADSVIFKPIDYQTEKIVDYENREPPNTEVRYLGKKKCRSDSKHLKFKGNKKKNCCWIARQGLKSGLNKLKKLCNSSALDREKLNQKREKLFVWCPQTCATVGLGECTSPSSKPTSDIPSSQHSTTPSGPPSISPPSSPPSGPSSSPPSGPSSRCIELCNIEGNRGEVIPAGANMRELIYDYYHPNTKEDMQKMYGNDINCWNISLVTSLDSAFRNQRHSNINQPLDCWNTEGITSMSNMFNGAQAFNQDLNMWKVNSVTNMYQMFLLGTIFNQDLSAWDVSSVSDMTQMFYMATSFNQDLSMWKVNNVKKTHQMFYQAALFNQDLSAWDVTSVTDMRAMFRLAESFNQNLCKWSYPPNSRNFADIFLDTACDNQNYPTKSAACQSCSRRHLDINDKIKNNNNNNRNNNHIL